MRKTTRNAAQARKDNKVAAILHSGYPVRYWDADLGPAQPRLFAVERETGDRPGKPATVDAAAPLKLRNLTPDAGTGLRDAESVVSPDGKTIYSSFKKPLAKADSRSVLVAIDVATGARTVLLDTEGMSYFPGPVSPDNRTLVVLSESDTTPQQAPRSSCTCSTSAGRSRLRAHSAAGPRLGPLATPRRLAAGRVRAPGHRGRRRRRRPFSGSSDTGRRGSRTVTRVTPDAAAYTDVVVSPDGRSAYALRSSYEFPAEAVRIDLAAARSAGCPAPAERPSIPADRWSASRQRPPTGPACPPTWPCPRGPPQKSRRRCCCGSTAVRWVPGTPGRGAGTRGCWLPRATRCCCRTRHCPPATARHYIQRGWGGWGKAPFTDLMAVTDAVVERPDIDGTRTAAMGGSFGGYMANWVAGHTDRFKAIVTHASLWALDQFGPTTDASQYWLKEMTAEMALENSPHLHVEKISTPMLVIHGDKDYRVPIGEGLRLWYELLVRVATGGRRRRRTAHRFLYFPDENHWILQPQHAKVWYGGGGALPGDERAGPGRAAAAGTGPVRLLRLVGWGL